MLGGRAGRPPSERPTSTGEPITSDRRTDPCEQILEAFHATAAPANIGVAGVDAGTRLRVRLVLGMFEAGTPLLGLVLVAVSSTVVSGAL